MSSITAGTSTTNALVNTGDTTGNLVLQTNNGTTALTLNTSQAIGVGSSPSYGTSGQFLTSAGSGASPTWTTPTPAGVIGNPITATTGSVTFAGFSGTPLLQKVISVDSTHEMLFVYDSGTYYLYAVMYDTLANTFGSPVLVRAASLIANYAYYVVSASQVLVTTVADSATTFEAVVLSISGTTITVNTAATKTIASTPSSFNNIYAVGSTYVVAYTNATSTVVLAMTISGTTVTIGSELVLIANLTNGFGIAVLDTTRFLAVYTNSTTTTTFKPVSVSGTTLTAGTTATTTTNAYFVLYVSLLSSGRVAVITCDSSATAMSGYIVTVSSTTATRTVISFITPTSAATKNRSLGITVGNQVLFYDGATSVNVLTDNSGTATAGTVISNLFSPSYVPYIIGNSIYSSSGNSDLIKVSISGNNPVSSLITGAPNRVESPSGYAVNTLTYPSTSINQYGSTQYAYPIYNKTGILYGNTYAVTYTFPAAFSMAATSTGGAAYTAANYGYSVVYTDNLASAWNIIKISGVTASTMIRLTVA